MTQPIIPPNHVAWRLVACCAIVNMLMVVPSLLRLTDSKDGMVLLWSAALTFFGQITFFALWTVCGPVGYGQGLLQLATLFAAWMLTFDLVGVAFPILLERHRLESFRNAVIIIGCIQFALHAVHFLIWRFTGFQITPRAHCKISVTIGELFQLTTAAAIGLFVYTHVTSAPLNVGLTFHVVALVSGLISTATMLSPRRWLVFLAIAISFLFIGNLAVLLFLDGIPKLTQVILFSHPLAFALSLEFLRQHGYEFRRVTADDPTRAGSDSPVAPG